MCCIMLCRVLCNVKHSYSCFKILNIKIHIILNLNPYGLTLSLNLDVFTKLFTIYIYITFSQLSQNSRIISVECLQVILKGIIFHLPSNVFPSLHAFTLYCHTQHLHMLSSTNIYYVLIE